VQSSCCETGNSDPLGVDFVFTEMYFGMPFLVVEVQYRRFDVLRIAAILRLNMTY
jgi:hypothetical protein